MFQKTCKVKKNTTNQDADNFFFFEGGTQNSFHRLDLIPFWLACWKLVDRLATGEGSSLVGKV